MATRSGNNFFFRVDDATIEKFNRVVEAQNSLYKKMGVGTLTKTQIMQNIIADQYLKYLNNDKDPDTTDRINMIIDSKLRTVYEQHNKVLQDLLFETVKANAQMKILLIKNGINIHNTEIKEMVTTTDELESLIDALVAEKVFGEKKQVTYTKSEVKHDDEEIVSSDELDPDKMSDEEFMQYVDPYYSD